MQEVLCPGGESKLNQFTLSLFRLAVTLCLLPATMTFANSEARSFCNDTGGAANDWHVLVRNGAANLNYVTSNGLSPSFTPMSTTSAPSGGGPYNNGTLTGGNVPNGGCISVTYGYNALSPGNLDWYWTNNGTQVGKLHKDGQQWYFSVSNYNPSTHQGDVLVTIQNTSNEDAAYSNFVVGTSDDDPDFGPFSFDPGTIPSPSDIYEPPANFTVNAGGAKFLSFFDVFVDLNLDAYGSVSLPDESFYQLESQKAPEPGSLLLIGSGLLSLLGIKRKRSRV